MKTIYLIRDNVSEQCTPLFIEKNVESAKRQLQSFISGSQFNPSSYDLYQVGTFDSESATITSMEKLHIVNGAAVDPLERI
ncbi:MAG: hypothetical protein LBB56_03000 [Chitinispirillales bacterium]|jgi:hypothetical protein|nr:hypothetical protein [Chitinispirillales bacterium]